MQYSKNTDNQAFDICPIPPRKRSVDSSIHTTENKKLIDEYKQLTDRIKVIRGILYKQGIDPEQFK
jgi:hypothetical protein